MGDHSVSAGEHLAVGHTLMRGLGVGRFDKPIQLAHPGGHLGDSVVGDFDGDGIPDVAAGKTFVGGRQVVGVLVLRGLGGGRLDPAPGYVSVVDGSSQGTGRVVVSKVGDYARDVSVADLDGTADLDVVTTRGQFVVAAVFDPLT